jgi:hypothetical protein
MTEDLQQTSRRGPERRSLQGTSIRGHDRGPSWDVEKRARKEDLPWTCSRTEGHERVPSLEVPGVEGLEREPSMNVQVVGLRWPFMDVESRALSESRP